MSPHEAKMIQHALAILRGSIDDGMGRPLTACEKLACRILLPMVGKEALVRFCDQLERGNPMYRQSYLTHAVDAMVEQCSRRR